MADSTVDVARRPRVLVVYDTPDMRRSIARVLKARVEVTEAEDGQAAVDLITQAQKDGAQFDALVIDVDMPRLNGRQALAAIAAVAPGLSDRAVVMSGGAWEGDVAKWLGALPAHRVLRKPMSNDDLREAVRRALE